jgi:hypothetical protein
VARPTPHSSALPASRPNVPASVLSKPAWASGSKQGQVVNVVS